MTTSCRSAEQTERRDTDRGLNAPERFQPLAPEKAYTAAENLVAFAGASIWIGLAFLAARIGGCR